MDQRLVQRAELAGLVYARACVELSDAMFNLSIAVEELSGGFQRDAPQRLELLLVEVEAAMNEVRGAHVRVLLRRQQLDEMARRAAQS